MCSMQTALLKTMQPERVRRANNSSHSYLTKAMALAAMSLGRSEGGESGGWLLGRRRESRTDGGPVHGWCIDHAGRLALDIFGQSADRHRRPLARLALCRGHAAARAARDRSSGPDRGDHS